MRALRIAGVLLLSTSALLAQGMSKSAPKKQGLTWGPAPAVFAAGAQMAVVSGNPMAAGPYAIRLKLPNGYKIAPHFHPTDETVEVKQGVFLYGMGDTFDATAMKTMNVKDKGTLPANGHHYATAKGATIIEVSATTGPFVLTYVNPADDPTKKASK